MNAALSGGGLIAVKRILMVSLLLAAMIAVSSLEAQEPKETVVGKGAFYGGTDGRTIRLERTKSTFVVDKFEKKSLSILLPLEADSTATLVIEPHRNFAKNPDHSLSGAVAK